jgi:N-methylhydantoinase A
LQQREDVSRFQSRRFARIRFQWQRHELEMRLPDKPLDDAGVEQIAADFVAMYGQRYGEAALLPGARLEIVSLRLEPAIAAEGARLDRLSVKDQRLNKGTRQVWFERGQGPVDADVHDGDAMPIGATITGPAVIDLAITGIVLPPGTTCERRATGDFVLTLNT